MHGVAEAGSVRASQCLRREHAAYMATLSLALDAWLNQNINKKGNRDVFSWPDYGSVCLGWDKFYRNNAMKFGIGFTQETPEVVHF